MTAHRIAQGILRQLSSLDAIGSVAASDYGALPRFYLDDDDPGDTAPHVIATPDGTEGGHGPDSVFTVRVIVSARDREGEGVAPVGDPGSGDGVFFVPAAERFDRFADSVWRAIPDLTPGAILAERSAEWAFAGFQPLRFAIFTLTYRQIHSFGD